MRESEALIRSSQSGKHLVGAVDPLLRQFLGSNLDPSTFGPMHVAINGYDPADWTAADATISAGLVGTGYWNAHCAMTQVNVAIAGGSALLANNGSMAGFEPVAYQLPELGSNMHKCALRTCTMTLDIDVSVSSKGRVFFGTIPVQETYGDFSGQVFGVEECSYFKNLKQITLSEIAANGGLTIAWHRLSPLADQYKDPEHMALAFDEAQAQKFEMRAKHAPYTSVNHRKSMISSKRSAPSAGDKVGAPGDGYTPTLDCMVPFIMIMNESGENISYRVQVKRTWDITFVFGDSQMIPIASGPRGYPVIPEKTAAVGNTILKHLGAVPTEHVDTVITELARYGKAAINWSQSPDGKQTIKTALDVLGTGVSVGAALLPILL